MVTLVNLVTVVFQVIQALVHLAIQDLADTQEQAATAVEAAFQASAATLALAHQDILV